MAIKYRQFVTTAAKRAIRKELLYQVLVEDICAVFGAGTKELEKFQQLINGVADDKVFTEKETESDE